MNKLLKIIIISVLIIIMSCQYITIVNAADETSNLEVITLKTKKTQIEPKDEIKLYIYYGEKQKYNGGIAYIEGKIEYDKNVLEAIINSDSTYNDWIVAYNETNGKIVLERNDAVTDPQEVAEIVFKVKDKVAVEETKIYLKDIEVANPDDEDTVKIKDAEIKLNISKTSSGQENTNTTTNNTTNNTNNNTGNTTVNNTVSNAENTTANNNEIDKDKKQNANSDNSGVKNDNTIINEKIDNSKNSSSDETSKSGSLPYTGTVSWIIIAILLIGVVGFISYKKYEKYKNI